MNALSILQALIKESEGCSLKAYLCPAKVLTIGWGFTHGVKEGMVWTQEQADEALLKEATACLDQALRYSPVLKLETIQRQAAIADFIYNLGPSNYNQSTLKIRVGQRNWSSAAIEIKRWNKGGGKVLAGLIKRRAKEATLLLA
jgi:lysozyme